jgi:hypothetical protein
MGPVGMEVTRLLNFAFRGTLNQGVVPRLPVFSRGQWKLVSAVELIHDYWPGRPSSHRNSAFNQKTSEIWHLYREDNRRLDEEYRLGLGDYDYY